MKKYSLSLLIILMILACNCLVIQAAESGASTIPSDFPIKIPLKWKASGKLLSPKPDDNHRALSVKDPTVVYYNGKWHVYATVANGGWSMQYFSFSDWSQAPDAIPTYIDVNPNFTYQNYNCAPHLFYFTPQKKWYLVFQTQPPKYCTTDDISKPETWTAPKPFFQGQPRTLQGQWIDFHCIADETHVYMFFTGDNGNFWRCRTKIEDFPNGFSDPELAIRDTTANIFEGSITYKIKNSDYYITLIEGLGTARHYSAWISKDLNGEWTPLKGADSYDTPFAGLKNVTFEDGVTPWTREISHGEMLRDGYDEKMIIDPENLQFLFQGNDTTATQTAGGRGGRGGRGGGGGGYNSLPYRLGLLTAVK